jgi:hypothetical protein
MCPLRGPGPECVSEFDRTDARIDVLIPTTYNLKGDSMQENIVWSSML